MDEKFRLVTTSNIDGLVCAVILKQLNLIDEIKFVHPKDMQDGTITITENDIITNLPYVAGAHLVFDHHESEAIRNEDADNHIIIADAPSSARVVYDYYLEDNDLSMISEDMMLAVDKDNTAQFSKEEILNPQGWDLLCFLIDSRTGLERCTDISTSNYDLMMELIDYCPEHSIEDILNLPDVKERADLLNKHSVEFQDEIRRCATIYDNLLVLEFRDEEIVYPGNRFMIYAMFPEINISIHVIWGYKDQNTVFAIGKSIINRSSKTNIGELMLKYGGGGHITAGTCQIDHDKCENVLEELITKITDDG